MHAEHGLEVIHKWMHEDAEAGLCVRVELRISIEAAP